MLFDGGIDLTRLDEAAIANLGIGRKFQKPTVFENLSVLENLELAFTNDRRPEVFAPEATEQAFQRTFAFFREHLA